MKTKHLICDNHIYFAPSAFPPPCEELRRHQHAGFNWIFVNLGDSDNSLERVVRMGAYVRAWVADNEREFAMVGTWRDIEQAHAEGKVAVAFDIEGAFSLGEQVSLVPTLHAMGVRWMSVVYNRRNAFGFGCHDPVDEGLTPLGRELVRAMDRVGIIKCCSHAGYRTAMDVLSGTDAPTIFSHSNPRALKNHARNIPDDLIKACAATGGLVGINGIQIFLRANACTAENVAEHVDYVASLVGVGHVGLGLDYGYTCVGAPQMELSNSDFWPPGNEYGEGVDTVSPEALDEIVESLIKRGYRNADLEKILGGNMARVAKAVWKA